MFKRLVPFNTHTFAQKRIKPVDNFRFAANSYIASVFINEFKQAALYYPIVFLKEGDGFGSYVLMGLKSDQNLSVDEQGQWRTGFIPGIIRRYPFALGKNDGGSADEFLICIDESSEFISQEEGQPLVGEDGRPGKIVENAKAFLSELYRASELTARFCKELADLDLLGSLNVQLKDNATGQVQKVSGCYSIDEKKLNKLPDEDVLQLHKSGALSLIYTHLVSLGQIERLAQMQAEHAKK